MSNQQLRVGMIGAGRMGHYHSKNIQFTIGNAKVTKIYDIDMSHATLLKQVLQNNSDNTSDEITVCDCVSDILESQDIDCVVIASLCFFLIHVLYFILCF